jgi:hypothetical protein
MNKHFKWSLILGVSLVLQSCTIAHYQIANKLHTHAGIKSKNSCNISYHISIDTNPRQFTRKPQYNDDQLKKDNEVYVQSTEKVFTDHGCAVQKVEIAEEADFKIEITQSPLWSALPQEWLTGLSFGAIPSWGTREREYTFGFNDIKLKKEHIYVIDNKSYNHIILFPVFWITFVTLDKGDVYAEALSNFLENS